MIDVGNDGDISYRLGHRGAFSFLFGSPPTGEGTCEVGGRHRGELPHGAAVFILPAAGFWDCFLRFGRSGWPGLSDGGTEAEAANGLTFAV